MPAVVSPDKIIAAVEAEKAEQMQRGSAASPETEHAREHTPLKTLRV